MAINKLFQVNINNSEQWILVRSKISDAPLLIQVQMGPGLPMICEANTMERLHRLEEHYLVAYWDQRACGKSFDKTINPATINLAQLTRDLIACTQYLLEEYKKDRAVAVGYSLGATISLLAAAKNRDLFSQLFLAGIDIDIPYANKYALEFAFNKAKDVNDKKLIRKITELSASPITNAKSFQKRAKILTDLGGVKTGSSYNHLMLSAIRNLLFTKAYSLKDVLKTIQGMSFCQDALLGEFDTFNLFDKVTSVDVPVYFIQGKLDAVAPPQMAVKFYEYLKADVKNFMLFENSAHMPHYEEPEMFGKLLKGALKNSRVYYV
jgi:pimeloyl-ACP methyl ester carboxylesterase